MGKQGKILIILFVLLTGIILITGSGPKKIDWRPTYLCDDKIPFGTYVVYHELESFFPGAKIKTVNKPPYEYLKKNNVSGTYIFINQEVPVVKEEWEKLMDFVEQGNDVLIASNNINFDSLGFKTGFLFPGEIKSSPVVSLVNPAFGNQKYNLKKELLPRIFEEIDTQNTTVLGNISFLSENGEVVNEGINFVKCKYGQGHFYFHTNPKVFTNYFVLDSVNNHYTSGVLTYLGHPGTIHWDAYYKNGKVKIKSPLYYIFNTRSLKWAYYILLAGILLFVIFEGRRKQRSIRVLKPNENKTLQFTRTIANMYYEKANHKKIADMKIDFFMEYIRKHFLLDTQKTDETFIKALAAKSGQEPSKVKKIIDFFTRIKAKSKVTKEELADLEDIIENFKKQNQWTNKT